jgi:hypothetical protein
MRTMDTSRKINQNANGEQDKKQTAETWNWVNAKTNSKKQKTNDTSNTIKNTSLNYPIITSNRFTMLHNLKEYEGERNEHQTQDEQDRMYVTHKSTRRRNFGQKIPTIVNGIAQHIDNRKPFINKNKIKKHKILILGDSHARGCATEVKHYLSNEFEVCRTTISGAGMKAIKASADKKIHQLTQKDVMVLWGGSNDVARNNSTEGLKMISKLLIETRHTNVILLTVPHRHDLVPNSCVNIEVEVFNRRLYKDAERFKEVQIMEVVNERSHYTRHGQHLNLTGKDYMAKRITTMIEHVLNDVKAHTREERHRNIDPNSPNHQAPLTVPSSDPKATVNRNKEDKGITTILISPTKQETKQVPQAPISNKIKKPISGEAGQNLTVSQAPCNNNKEPSKEDGEEGGSSINQGDAEVGVASNNQGVTEVGVLNSISIPVTSSHQDTPFDESNKKNEQTEAQNNNTHDAKNTQTSPILIRRNCLARRDPDFLWM